MLVVIGLVKKIVIADNMATIANAVFFRLADGRRRSSPAPEALSGVYAFAFQIYARLLRLQRPSRSGIANGSASSWWSTSTAVPRGEPERLLAALAHQPLDVAPRLPLHSRSAETAAAAGARRTATSC